MSPKRGVRKVMRQKLYMTFCILPPVHHYYQVIQKSGYYFHYNITSGKKSRKCQIQPLSETERYILIGLVWFGYFIRYSYNKQMKKLSYTFS